MGGGGRETQARQESVSTINGYVYPGKDVIKFRVIIIEGWSPGFIGGGECCEVAAPLRGREGDQASLEGGVEPRLHWGVPLELRVCEGVWSLGV